MPQPRFIDTTEHRTSLPYSSKSDFLISQSFFAPDMRLVHHTAGSTSTPAPSLAKMQARGDFTPDLSDLKTIATVVSVAKPSYDIQLTLRPLSDPAAHNPPELWVDASTFDILQAVIDGKYAPDPSAPIEPTTVTEDFARVGPYWVVIHRRWTYSVLITQTVIHFDSTERR